MQTRTGLCAGLLVCLVAVFLSSALTSTAEAVGTEPVIYDPRPQNSWGVDGLDPGSGNFQYFAPIFAFEQVGDTMFAGGKFLEVTNGQQSSDQPHLAAFDVETGDWKPAFDPAVTWSVFALASDGNRLFVGGEFPSVNGDTTAAGFATVDTTTGDLVPFGVTLGNNDGSQPRVHALDIADGYLYIAGSFFWIEGSDGVRSTVTRLARVSLDTGIVDTSWTPTVSGGSIWDIATDPLHDRVLIGGPFRQVNGEDTAAFAMIDDRTPQLTDYDRGFGLFYFDQPGTDYDFASSLAVSDDRLVIGGQQHRLVVTDADLNVLSVHLGNRYEAANGGRGGDIQDIAIDGDIAFIACHCWGQLQRELPDKTLTGELTDVRSTFAVDLTTGRLATWFQPDFSGTAGPWALRVDQDECLWVGTDATQSGQRAARGVVKLCQTNNLAFDATLSLISADGTPFTAASNANDGNLVTNDNQSPGMAISLPNNTPHLDIDLGSLKSVEDVILWNRTDAEREKLRNVRVWTSTEPFPSNAWSALRADPAVTEVTKLGDHGRKRTLSIEIDDVVRYLRVEVDFRDTGAPDRIQIAEVVVTGGDAPDGDPDPDPEPGDGPALTSTVQTRERIVLRWQPSEAVDIFRDGVLVASDNDGWYTDLGLSAGTSYTYVIETADGRSSTLTVSTQGDLVDPDPDPDPDPDGLDLTSTVQTRERIVLRWQPSVQVDIFRDGTLIGSDGDGWFTDLGLSAATTYTYRVEAADGSFGELVVSTNP